jgi:heptosyltransferase-2
LLVRGVNWLGDAVMTTPALQRLREHFAGARITMLTSEKLADVWQQHPSLDTVLTFAEGESPWSVAKRLRAERFGAAIVLPNSIRAALEVWLARIPERFGLARAGRNWLLTRAVGMRPGRLTMRRRSMAEIRRLVDGDGSRATDGTAAFETQDHQMHDYLHLVAALGGNPQPIPTCLNVTAQEVSAVGAKFGLANEVAGLCPVVGISPGAQYGPAKRWPVERFAAAACRLDERTSCTWLIFGGSTDDELTGRIELALQERRRQGSGRGSSASTSGTGQVLNLAGRTSLRELCALLKLCRVVLTNDSGPMHVAAALETAVVVPFGSTSPELTGPGLAGNPRHRLLRAGAPCSPCFRRQCPIDFRCMTGISVEQVVAAVRETLG